MRGRSDGSWITHERDQRIRTLTWDLGRALNKIEAVKKLHRKEHDGYIGLDICVECSDTEGRIWQSWPCPTMAAIEGVEHEHIK